MTEQQFDVFLAHSSNDKPLIRQIYQKLTAQGIRPWLDEEGIAPGTKFQDEIQQAIGRIKTTAIFWFFRNYRGRPLLLAWSPRPCRPWDDGDADSRGG